MKLGRLVLSSVCVLWKLPMKYTCPVLEFSSVHALSTNLNTAEVKWLYLLDTSVTMLWMSMLWAAMWQLRRLQTHTYIHPSLWHQQNDTKVLQIKARQWCTEGFAPSTPFTMDSSSFRTWHNQYDAAGALACARRRSDVTRCSGILIFPHMQIWGNPYNRMWWH